MWHVQLQEGRPQLLQAAAAGCRPRLISCILYIWLLKCFQSNRPSGPMLFISQNVHLSVCLSICPSVCLFTFEVLFKRLFVPTSQSRRSNIFRDLESLGKSNGKKWSQIWTFFYGSSLKSPRKKTFVFFADFAIQTCWKLHFPMDERPLVKGYIANFGHICGRFWVFSFWMNFSVFSKIWVFGYSWSTLPWYWCYYPHRSRDALSPVCGIFYQPAAFLT